jgi:hypothetical protein
VIPASAEWIAQENNPASDPVYFATFLPHYFITGVAAGSGTFVNMSFIAPGRLQVDEDAGLASWTSPVLAAVVANYPTAITPTWSLSFPGFDCVMEYRTAASVAGVATAAWLTLLADTPISFYRYYQWRISFVSIRSWAYDTQEEAEASGSSAWALDVADPSDPYESFAVDSAYGTAAYIEDVWFAGIFEVDPADIKDWGTIKEECSPTIGDLVSGSYTIVLANRDNKYSSTHENFVFAAESHPEKKQLLIEMAYRLPNGTYTERRPLYLGTVQEWGPTPGGTADKTSGKLQEHTAAILTRNLIADIQDKMIGMPGDDGKANPLVMGEVFRQLDQAADETLGDPDAAVDFESGDTTGLAGVDSANGGVVAVASADPINGAYYLHTEVANASAYAKGRLDLAAAGVEVLCTVNMRFVTIPEAPADKTMYFMGLYDNAGNEVLKLFVGSDFRVYAYAAGEYKETDWYVDRDIAAVKRVSIGVSGYTAGTLKLWVNSNEVLTWDADWSAMSIKGAFFGPHNGATAEPWSLDWDDPTVYPNWWPQLFRSPGGSFQSIGTVYIEGAMRVGPEVMSANQNRRNLRFGPAGVSVSLVSGTTKTTGVEKYAEYGAIAFTDYSNKISGTVAAYLRKGDTVHWVDAVRALLAVHGFDAYVDEDAMTAAKAATPDDSAGYYFDQMNLGDAIKALASTCLFSFFQTGNLLRIKAYTGEAPTAYDLELTSDNLQSWSSVKKERDIKNKVLVKYGRYAQNNRLSKTAKDDDSIKFVGLYDSEIDLSWSNGCIGSDSGPMAQHKADVMLRRLVGGQLNVDPVVSGLNLARLQAGDTVQVNVPDIGPAFIVEIANKELELMTPKGTRLALNRFLGEQAAA